MRILKEMTTDWLRAEHPALVTRMEDAFASVADIDDISQPDRARRDIFHLMSDYFYEPAMADVTQTRALEIVRAGAAMWRAIFDHSEDLEAYLLDNGVVESSEWAPRASGF